MKIEKNVPMPSRGVRFQKYPFHEMEVGDSFFCPSEIATTEQIRNAAGQYTQRYGKRLSVRKQDGGCRVWRIG